MQQAMVEHSRGAAARIDGHQDVINFDLAEGHDHSATMGGEHCPQTVAAGAEGNVVILDDTPQRYSGTRDPNADSHAYLEGCLRVLQSIVGRGRRREI